MWPYWLLFFFPAFQAINTLHPKSFGSSKSPLKWRLTAFVITLMIGLRHEVGGDWINYIELLDELATLPLDKVGEIRGDIAFNSLCWVGSQTGLGIYLPNLVAAWLFTWGLMTFCRNSPRPWLGLVVAVPYLITVVGMGYSRQAAAIGLMMLGLVALEQKLVFKFLLWTAIAAVFHKSAVILVPLAVFSGNRRPVITAIALAGTGALLYILLLQEYVDFLIYGYIENEYQSTGAAIRIAMNALPACFFLLFRKRFNLGQDQQKFWTWMSWGALGFVFLLNISPSSTAVDRVALYWIPLQIYVGSRLPDAMLSKGVTITAWVYLIVAYCAAVHFVWLFFANYSSAWLPYRFLPWEWLWF